MRKSSVFAVIAATFYAISNIAFADQVTQSFQKGGTCWSQPPSNARTVPKLHCEELGDVGISDLYQKGFRVAAVYTDMREPFIQIYIIESQR